jgi:hypothetical protein
MIWIECHLRFLGEVYWGITKTKHTIPKNGPSTLDELREEKYNIKEKESLLSALTNTKMKNVMDLQTTHEILKKLEIVYEGDC